MPRAGYQLLPIRQEQGFAFRPLAFYHAAMAKHDPAPHAKQGAATDEDHRVSSARRKRERMRAHLFESILVAYPGPDPSVPAVIDDVVRQAGVSRGTFYKYFRSLEQAVEELGARQADELVKLYAFVYETLEDARMSAATGFQLFLSRAAVDPHWGAFIAHLTHVSPDSGLMRQIRSDLNRGVKAGVFSIDDLDVALDLIIGTKVEGIRHLISFGPSRTYIEMMTGMILRSLGVAPMDANGFVQAASDRLHEMGPAQLPWWRPFT